MKRSVPKRILPCGQTLGEYAVLLAVVVSAIMAMQVYVQRGLQARHHDLTHYLIDKLYHSLGRGSPTEYQYEPYYTKSSMEVEGNVSQREDMLKGLISRNISEFSKKSGSQEVLPKE